MPSSKSTCLGWCPPSFKPTKWDYAAYEERAYQILSSPGGRAAILQGGIVWRLALEILGEDAVSYALKGPSSDVSRYGRALQPSRGPLYYDDALLPEEIDIICGTYKIAESGHGDPVFFSWWPRPPQWQVSGLNVGHWAEFCEDWFQERLHAIRQGTAVLYSGAQWRAKVSLSRGAHKLSLAVAKANEKFLSDVLCVSHG
ncbi:hypothetical protein BD414DRAFT_415633 [Trametes punicea]|nr:hypothetical protein BD414DRAFT_415633 [Trametes punicea]